MHDWSPPSTGFVLQEWDIIVSIVLQKSEIPLLIRMNNLGNKNRNLSRLAQVLV